MNWGLARRVVLIGAILLLPVAAFAQEAVLTGTVVDSTGAVLPGVTVTATNSATGNKFVGVTELESWYPQDDSRRIVKASSSNAPRARSSSPAAG